MKRVVGLLGIVAVCAALAGGPADVAGAAESAFVNIGTAGIGGTYYPTGGYICGVMNAGRAKYGHNIRCSVESTGGSVANLRSIQAGDMSVGLTMSAYALPSFSGTGTFEKDGANKKLRYLFGIVEEPVQIMARKGLGIKNFKDLQGKIVNSGAVGSGTEAMVYDMLKRYGTTAKQFFKQEAKLSTREQSSALCDGKIDAFIWVAAVGAGTFMEASNTCATEMVAWDDDVVDKMLTEKPEAAKMVIPASSYRGQEKDIVSWGTPGIVVAAADVPDSVVYYLVKGVFDDIETFKKQSPMYKNLTAKWGATAGKTIPYHPGAEKYFREVGLIK